MKDLGECWNRMKIDDKVRSQGRCRERKGKVRNDVGGEGKVMKIEEDKRR